MSFFEIRNLNVAYGKPIVVKALDLSIEQKELVCLIGGNGAGKTTILRTIAGLLKPRSGSILFEDKAIEGLHPADIVSLGIAMVPEKRNIFYDLSVRDNLRIGSYLRWNKKTIASKLEKMIELFPILGRRAEQDGGTLSGGEQQMLAIARSLMSEPKLLLLDEPSMGLAPLIVKNVFQKIMDVMALGMTILLVEQNAKMALLYSQKGYVIENGRIVIRGESRHLMNHEVVKSAYLGR